MVWPLKGFLMAHKKQTCPDIASKYWHLQQYDTPLRDADPDLVRYDMKYNMPREGDAPLSIEDYEIATLFIDDYTGEESVFKYLDPRGFSNEDTQDIEQDEEGHFDEPY